MRSNAYRVTDISLVPTMIQMFVDFPGLYEFDLSSLRRRDLWRLADERGGA